MNDVMMGRYPQTWKANLNIKYITFNITEDCNLRCTYCYFTHKNSKTKMNIETAKAAVDFILSDTSLAIYDGVVWDFIGGEPTLEMDLIDEICDYILVKMYIMGHKWLNCYRIMIGTNGLLYGAEKVQKFVKKHGMNVLVNITVDGSKEKHDLSRIKVDGSGSYDDVSRILPMWFAQTGGVSTKATFSHEDLPFLKDSIVNLWQLGFKYVMANVVYEDVWHEGDVDIFESQLIALADYIIVNELWNDCSVRFFTPSYGYSKTESDMKSNYCGSGNMLAIDSNGDFFPCVRFLDTALNNRKGRRIGNIREGFDYDKIRAFNALTDVDQSDDECKRCLVSNGCSWCTGFNYDAADHDTIFQRKKFNCLMHKANVRADKYFWNRFEKATGRMSPMRYNQYTSKGKNQKYLFIMADDFSNYCHSAEGNTEPLSGKVMPEELISRAVSYCESNWITPVFVGFSSKKYYGYYISDFRNFDKKDEFNIDIINAIDSDDVSSYTFSNMIIFRAKYKEIPSFQKCLPYLAKTMRIELIITDVCEASEADIIDYRDKLLEIAKWLFAEWEKGNYLQVNVITDNLFLDKKSPCKCGDTKLTMAPDGNFYICPLAYQLGEESIGSLDTNCSTNSTFNKHIFLCEKCNAFGCENCRVLNKMKTGEYCVPFELECIKSNLEAEVSQLFEKMVLEGKLDLPFDIKSNGNDGKKYDPLVVLRGDTFMRKFRDAKFE